MSSPADRLEREEGRREGKGGEVPASFRDSARTCSIKMIIEIDHNELVPLQTGKHLQGLPKDESTSNDNEHRPKSLRAKDQRKETEKEEEQLHEGGEDGGHHLLGIWQSI